MRPPHTGRRRRDVVRALGAAAGGLIGHQPYLLAADLNLQSPAPAIVPLFLCGGAYCLGYTIDGQPFRAVADTGSPFVLVDGTCTEAGARTPWGCFRGTGRSSGLEDTEELFGGEDVGVEWRRGRLALWRGGPLVSIIVCTLRILESCTPNLSRCRRASACVCSVRESS